MAHVGQEGTLGHVGLFGCLFGHRQFLCARVDQFFKMLLVAKQFGFCFLALGNVDHDAAQPARFAILGDHRDDIVEPDRTPIPGHEAVFEIVRLDPAGT